jgi:hypothetical protein
MGGTFRRVDINPFIVRVGRLPKPLGYTGGVMVATPSTVLFRPVGQKEFDLIAATGFREFPPRLSWQPIFYPVLNEEYARFIAREWNTLDEASDYVGYVLRFAMATDYLAQYQVQKVGSAQALEYWIPAEDLERFNANILGPIELIATFLPPTEKTGK